jgi:hypothetical protein
MRTPAEGSLLEADLNTDTQELFIRQLIMEKENS